MRPAQKAPENPAGPGGDGVASRSFNEAGAKSAGKRGRAFRPRRRLLAASMRPAQKAPENRLRPGRNQPGVLRFNEAGAKSAGKRPRRREGHRPRRGLQ